MDSEAIQAHRVWIEKVVQQAKDLSGFPGTGAMIHMGDIAIELMDELERYKKAVDGMICGLAMSHVMGCPIDEKLKEK